ncbi:conserved hypothetical protein [Ricinus communis]|uniref:Uncharacterized protein n=1 Tax=Ricinus communis TaxID=3988 RepID=B9RY08_RICCO|nr:conserved hypothetical protein [Ricinus communis]
MDTLVVVLMWFIFYNGSRYVTEVSKRFKFSLIVGGGYNDQLYAIGTLAIRLTLRMNGLVEDGPF